MARRPSQIMRIARRTIRLLREKVPIRSAYLFGSHVDGSAHAESDIDIAVFSSRFDRMHVEERIDVISRVQMAIGAEVEIHAFPTRLLAHARPTNFVGFIIRHGKKIAA